MDKKEYGNNIWQWKKQELENKAKQKLANSSKEEKEIAAKQYKKAMTIFYIFISVLFFIGVIVTICMLLEPSDDPISIGASVVLFLIYAVGIFGPIIAIYLMGKKSTEELALFQMKIEAKKTISKLAQEQIVSAMAGRDFIVSKTINISASGCNPTKLLIDNTRKLFIYQQGNVVSKTYLFSDLINYEVYENGESKVKGRAGSALIGGAFFGLAGLIVGSSMSRKVNEKCNQLKLIIRLNDLDCPQIVITYVDNVAWDKTGFTYRTMKENLQTVCSSLEYILNAKTLEQSMAALKSNQEHEMKKNKSLKEQLQELKDMLNEGLITQEEYEQKKKQILNL